MDLRKPKGKSILSIAKDRTPFNFAWRFIVVHIKIACGCCPGSAPKFRLIPECGSCGWTVGWQTFRAPCTRAYEIKNLRSADLLRPLTRNLAYVISWPDVIMSGCRSTIYCRIKLWKLKLKTEWCPWRIAKSARKIMQTEATFLTKDIFEFPEFTR